VDKTLLIVTSDPRLSELVRDLFPRCGLEIGVTPDQGFHLASKNAFDLYIIDGSLAGGTAFHLSRRIRGSDCNTPVIFLSDPRVDGDHQRAIESGANACLDRLDGLSRLADTVHLLFRWSEDTSLNSRIAELAAIRDSINERLSGLDSREGQALHKAHVARERLMAGLAERRDVTQKAYEAFTAAGGTRAYFERWWPYVLNEVI
jgi:DNA-binding response OmpR family regulator